MWEYPIGFFRRYWFHLTAAFLILFSVIQFSERAVLSSLMDVGWVHRLVRTGDPLVDKERWDRWLAANADLFEALQPGAKIGILEALTDRWGVVWTRRDGRMVFQFSGRMKAEEPGVILCFSEETAEALLSISEREGPGAVRQAVPQRVRAGEIRAYYLKASQTLREEGFPAFMRTIGAWRGGPPFEIDEDPPQAGYRLLEPQGGRAVASHTFGNSSLDAVFDGTPATGWQSGESMNSRMFLQVDFGRELTVAGVELLNPWENRQDYPRGLEVAVSRDGTNWSVVMQATWSGEDAPRDGDVWVPFAPVQAQFLRLRQTEDQEQDGRPILWWWSVGELRVYAPELPSGAAPC